jgi:capsular exopolysaccharide synthesis family protein
MDRGLGEYLNVVKRWWWLLVISAIIPMAITYHFASGQPDVYQAQVTIVVGQSVFQDPNPDTREIDLSNTLAAAYAELVTRRTVLERVIRRLGLNTTPEGLARQIGVDVRSGAQLLEIRVVDANPETSALIANALADELILRSPASEESILEQQQFVEIQIKELEGKIEDVNAQIDTWTASLAELTSAAEIDEAQAQIDALEAVKIRYQATYVGLLSVSRSESANELSLFESAVVPSEPVPRQTRLVVAVSGVAGSGLAIGAILLMEHLDTSIRWSKHGHQSIVDLPVLGAVPQESRRESFLSGNPLSPIADAVRSLRANIFLTRSQRPYATLLLTSPSASEGKSFIVANLAIALAAEGNCVIVVDCDMRRPALHELFGQMNVVGLSEVLRGVYDAGDAPAVIPLQETDFENLRLLSAGRPPADPTALLTSARLPALLADLESQADVVLVDSPPVLKVPDARRVATLVEGTVLVASAGVTRRESVQRAKKELLAQEGINLLGIVINRVKREGDYYSHYARGTGRSRVKRWRRNGDREWLKPGEAAEILGISKSMSREWCKNGQLPATRKWLWWRVDRGKFAQMLKDTWDIDLGPWMTDERVEQVEQA